MSTNCILAIDQGTTNTKALLVDTGGAVITRASRPVAINYPKPAWVEQDPNALVANRSGSNPRMPGRIGWPGNCRPRGYQSARIGNGLGAHLGKTGWPLRGLAVPPYSAALRGVARTRRG